jgi:hypothetical protein
MNTNKTPNCSFELFVNPSFMSMFSYINTTLPNACTKMNLLYDLPSGGLVP